MEKFFSSRYLQSLDEVMKIKSVWVLKYNANKFIGTTFGNLCEAQYQILQEQAERVRLRLELAHQHASRR